MDDQSEGKRLRPFFTLSHLARLLLMVLLAATFVGTTGQAIWQLVQPLDSLTGVLVDVAETRVNRGYAIYNLVVRTDREGAHTVQLVNNGRILTYLLEHVDAIPGQVVIQHRQGRVMALELLDGESVTIRESRVPPLARLLIGLVPLLIFVFHLRPGLVDSRIRPAQAR